MRAAAACLFAISFTHSQIGLSRFALVQTLVRDENSWEGENALARSVVWQFLSWWVESVGL